MRGCAHTTYRDLFGATRTRRDWGGRWAHAGCCTADGLDDVLWVAAPPITLSPTLPFDQLTATTDVNGTWGPIQERDEDLAVASYRIRPDFARCKDSVTGGVLLTPLSAPALSDHRVVSINLLTTLVMNLMERGLSEGAADQQVKSLLGLEVAAAPAAGGRRLTAAMPALKVIQIHSTPLEPTPLLSHPHTHSLTHASHSHSLSQDFDPLAVLSDDRSRRAARAAAVRVLSRNAQVYALLSQATALLTGEAATDRSSLSRQLPAADLALRTLTDKLAGGRSTPLQLTSTKTVTSLIFEMATNSPGVVLTNRPDVLGAAAAGIVSVSGELARVEEDFAEPSDALRSIRTLATLSAQQATFVGRMTIGLVTPLEYSSVFTGSGLTALFQEACENDSSEGANCVLPPTAPLSPPPSPPPPSPPPSLPPPSPLPSLYEATLAAREERNDTLLIGLIAGGSVVFGLAVAFAIVACTGCLDGFMATPPEVDHGPRHQALQSLAQRQSLAQFTLVGSDTPPLATTSPSDVTLDVALAAVRTHTAPIECTCSPALPHTHTRVSTHATLAMVEASNSAWAATPSLTRSKLRLLVQGAQPEPDDSDAILEEFVLPDELSPLPPAAASQPATPSLTPLTPLRAMPAFGTPLSLPGAQSQLGTPTPISRRLRAVSMPSTAVNSPVEAQGGSPAGSDEMVAM